MQRTPVQEVGGDNPKKEDKMLLRKKDETPNPTERSIRRETRLTIPWWGSAAATQIWRHQARPKEKGSGAESLGEAVPHRFERGQSNDW